VRRQLYGTTSIQDPTIGKEFEIPELARRIVETPQFQRLRKLKQLGASHFKYPGATHTRFEHSLGVCYLAGKWVKSLRKRQPELGISDEDVLCAQIAGLCHDLGHGPFSHVFDGMVLEKVGVKGWSHENGSIMMLEHLLIENNIVLSQYGLRDDKDLMVIKEMIGGVPEEERKNRDDGLHPWPRKRFLFGIVSNDAESSLDVDKLDYLCRDSRATGLNGNSCEFKELLKYSRVMRCEDGLERICFPPALYATAFRVFQSRYFLHEEIYTHKVTKAYEMMITDLMVRVNENFRFYGKKISQAIFDPAVYVHLNDSILDCIGMYLHELPSTPENDGLKHLYWRISSGASMYKCLGWMPLPEHMEPYTVDEIALQICESLHVSGNSALDQLDAMFENEETQMYDGPVLRPDDLIVEIMKLHFGKKAESPLDSMYFFPFGCGGENSCKPGDVAEKGSVTKLKVRSVGLLQENYLDVRVRVFCKDDSLVELATKAYRNWNRRHAPDVSIMSQLTSQRYNLHYDRP